MRGLLACLLIALHLAPALFRCDCNYGTPAARADSQPKPHIHLTKCCHHHDATADEPTNEPLTSDQKLEIEVVDAVTPPAGVALDPARTVGVAIAATAPFATVPHGRGPALRATFWPAPPPYLRHFALLI